jgi:hypothetical protein
MRRVLIALSVLGLLAAPAARADDYSDPEYRAQDQENFSDSCPRFTDYMTPEWLGAATQEWVTHQPDKLERQISDPTHPKVGGGLVPLWNSGELAYWEDYRERRAADLLQPIRFRAATGAVLEGHVWRPDTTGVYPMVSITPGSVQATEADYYWAAVSLTDAGYVVLTFDAQGQGSSGTFGNEDLGPAERPTTEGVPFQQDVNFLQATVDAISFAVSTPDAPHAMAFDGDAAAGIDTVNPYFGQVERSGDGTANLGLAGHSYGARGVSYAQDPAFNTVNQEHVRAIVAWDNLAEAYTPTVPAMGHNGESFVFPSFNYSRPNPEGKKTAFNRWRDAGVDTMQIAPRAATHMEWGYHPPACGSDWGNAIAQWYTIAWFDKYLRSDPTADDRLLTTRFTADDNEHCDGYDHCFSIYYKSAYAFRDAQGALRSCDDMAHIADATACPDTDA